MLWLFLFVCECFLAVPRGRHNWFKYAASVYQVTKSLVEENDVSVAEQFGIPGRDDEVIQPLRNWSVARVTPSVRGFFTSEHGNRTLGTLIEIFAVSSGMPIISALLVVAVYALSRRLGASNTASVIVGIGGVAGTFVLAYTKEFFGEPLTALLLTVCIERVISKRPGQAASAMGLAILTRPQAVIFAPFMLWAAYSQGGTRAVMRRMLTPIAGALLVSLIYNWARFQDPNQLRL